MKLIAAPLENAFVRLEPLEGRHRAPLQPVASDPDIWRFTGPQFVGEGFGLWFDTMIDDSASGRQISFAVFDKRGGGYAGHTSYLTIAPAHQRVEIGRTWYGRDFQRTHVNPATKRLLLENAFANGAERVELRTRDHNLRSQGAMEKLGATREATLRSHMLMSTGERRGSVYFSILKHEWPQVRAGLDARLDLQ